jgi:hypothetical protein
MTELFFAILACAIAFLAGDRLRKRRDETEARNRAIATKERMQDAFQDHVGDDPDVLRSWLSERGKR